MTPVTAQGLSLGVPHDGLWREIDQQRRCNIMGAAVSAISGAVMAGKAAYDAHLTPLATIMLEHEQ
jgi:hypothetical protein